MKCKTYPRAMSCVLLLAVSGALLYVCGCKELSREGISFLTWSPDGRMLASIYDRVVYVGSPDGTVPLRSFEDLQIAENELQRLRIRRSPCLLESQGRVLAHGHAPGLLRLGV